jgi:2-hydroxychromene-2-carboxylate isomerase
MPSLTFWYEFASQYSYLAAARIEALAARASVEVEWRPFLLGPIFAAQGWNDSPFNLFPAKGAYAWRDLARCAADLGLEFRRPSQFPRSGLLAARIALSLPDRDRPAFSRAVYHANFVEDREISDASVVRTILDQLQLPADALLETASSPSIKSQLRAQTEAAIAAGIFGAPSFTVGDELFWGNDRLEQALAWAKK